MVMKVFQKVEAMKLRIQKSVFRIFNSVLMPRVTLAEDRGRGKKT